MPNFLYLPLSLIIATACVSADDNLTSDQSSRHLCSTSWYQTIEERVPTRDTQMHGPDIGSDEWKSVIEFKPGIRGKPNLPSRDSDNWCRYIDHLVQERSTTSSNEVYLTGGDKANGPSYACDKVRPGSIEAMICQDKELSALDRRLADVYAAAFKRSANERPPLLKAEQRGWIKGRNECRKNDDKVRCVRDEYRYRIAELQARYRLVPGIGPVRYGCGGNLANEVIVTFFQTDPQTLIAERGNPVADDA